MALQQVPAMIAAGVGCFKIEGRLKGPEYVAATTAAYRAGALLSHMCFRPHFFWGKKTSLCEH
jgi:collagenase-like PrtC family protease